MNNWLRYFEFFRRDPQRDIDDEIASHLEMRESDLRAQGLSADAAHERALREFGDAQRVRTESLRVDQRMMRREQRGEFLGTLWRDVRVALRAMRSNPGFAATSVLCSAAGIGITAAIASAAYSILIHPLPYRDGDRLIAIYAENIPHGWKGTNISYLDFVAWRDNNRAFSGMGIWTWTNKTVAATAESDAERFYGANVSWNLFQLLGVSPMLGRNFLQEEDAPGRDGEVILSQRMWASRFASDSAIIGKTIPLDGRPFTVIGVMPPGFNFPDRGDVWVPFAAGPDEQVRGNRFEAGAIGRLKPGVTVEQAAADLHRIDADQARQFPEANEGWRADVKSMRDDLVGNLRDPVRVLLVAVGLVLLLACLNVANLTLARGAARAREIAVRSAVGASRKRLVGQLLTESLVIAAIGGALGVGVAAFSIRVIMLAFPDGVPFYFHIGVDGASIAFVATITVVTAMLFGVVPALRVSRVSLNSALRGSSSSVDKARLRNALVIGEVALSALLMTGALLLVRSYRNLHDTPLGFSSQGVLSARLTLSRNGGYPTLVDVKRFHDAVLERLRADPNVASVGIAQGVPFSGWNVQGQADVEGMPRPRSGEEIIAHYQAVTPDWFRTLSVPLLRGRWLTEGDRDTANSPVLINQILAQRAFAGRDPMGQHIRIGDQGSWSTVVGIIGDVHQFQFPDESPPAMFWAEAAFPYRQTTIVLRVKHGDPRDAAPLLRRVVRELDPQVALYQVQPLEDVVTHTLWRQRLMGNVLGAFALLALAMACLGLYGVVSYMVTQRTRELGVRVALGATRGRVLRLVLSHGTRLVLAGIVAGLLAAYFGVRILGSLLYGVQATDPATFGLVALSLLLVALLAAAIPSRRATRVDPMIAMRAE